MWKFYIFSTPSSLAAHDMPKVNVRVGRKSSNFPHDNKTFSPISGKLKTF